MIRKHSLKTAEDTIISLEMLLNHECYQIYEKTYCSPPDDLWQREMLETVSLGHGYICCVIIISVGMVFYMLVGYIWCCTLSIEDYSLWHGIVGNCKLSP